MNRCGLYNIGWNCYINSTLQCLASCNIVDNILTKYSDEDKQIKDILEKYGYSSVPFRQAEFVTHTQKIISQLSLSNNTASGNSTSELDTETQKTLKLLNKIGEKGLKIFIYFEFHDIIKRLRELKKMNIDPRKFIRVLGTTSKPEFAHLFSGQQNDPHEFLMYLFAQFLQLSQKLFDHQTFDNKFDLKSQMLSLFFLLLRIFQSQYSLKLFCDIFVLTFACFSSSSADGLVSQCDL
jgi:ubiquitin C-terminal hydrolase